MAKLTACRECKRYFSKPFTEITEFRFDVYKGTVYQPCTLPNADMTFQGWCCGSLMACCDTNDGHCPFFVQKEEDNVD